MSIKIGIPRGLFYYRYYPLWKTFLEELGAEIVVSDYSNKKILDDGVKSCVDEACLPVKLFHGHVLNLKDRVDYIFIPRFTSVSKNEYICPKFGGLPDMVKNTLKELPGIIDTEVNMRKDNRSAKRSAIDIGGYLTNDEGKIIKAYKKALEAYRNFRQKVLEGRLPCDLLEDRERDAAAEAGSVLKIVLIGHEYNVYDSFINMNIIKKLQDMGALVITTDMVDGGIIDMRSAGLNKKMFWNFGRKAVGVAFNTLAQGDADGIIYMMSFGCGVDSFVCDLIERKIRRSSNIPFIALTLDEHSGEAGMNTRIEAFIDMIGWRRKNDNHISAFR